MDSKSRPIQNKQNAKEWNGRNAKLLPAQNKSLGAGVGADLCELQVGLGELEGDD